KKRARFHTLLPPFLDNQNISYGKRIVKQFYTDCVYTKGMKSLNFAENLKAVNILSEVTFQASL
ncbi:MAG: hypothetical protein IKY45_01205, partial [Clostridia bacterium]|nr:hypothetical protein [Clostridia bacterium]